MPLHISLVAALSENRVIGKNGQLPWHLSDDLKRFKALTTGHPIIMGRKTFESIGRPLPNRANIIVSRDANLKVEGCTVIPSLEEALKAAEKIEKEEIFIIGGGQIFSEALTQASRLYLTLVHAIIEGDTFFPEYEHLFSRVVSREDAEEGEYSFTYLTLEH